jgi:hypothetical protein
MSQAGYTPILIYNSTTAAAVPVNTNLANGELAINITDGKLYYKDNTGTVRLLADNAVTTPVTSITFASTGLTPATATSGAVTVGGTLAIGNGGTDITTYTTGDILYASATNVLSKLASTTAGYVLTAGGVGVAPAWAASTGGVTSFSAGTTGLTPNTGTTGAITLAGTLAIANGGTGQTTANTAFNALAPSQTSANGKYLTSDGTNTSWGTVSAGAALSNDTATATNVYPMFAAATSGTPTTVYTSNAKLLYKPSTGEFQASVPVALNGLFVNATTLVASYTVASGQSAQSVGGTSGFTIPGGLSVTLSSGSRWVVL